MSDYPPKKGAAFSVDFPIFDTSGKLLTGATISSAQVSKDGGAWANTTNAVAENNSPSGVYVLSLTSTEMTADRVAVKVVVSGSQDVFMTFETVTRQMIDLAYPSISGQSLALDGSGGVTVAQFEAAALTAIETEAAAALGTDTLSELAQGQPPVNPTMKQAIMFLYMALRNNLLTTGSQLSVCNDSGTVICKATLTDDGTTFTRSKVVSGP